MENNIPVDLSNFKVDQLGYVDQGKEGLHHVRYDVSDLQAIIDKFKEEGIDVSQSGKIVGLKYAYMDTEALLGIILEFSAIKRGRRRR